MTALAPSLQEEVDRKAMDTIQKIMIDLENGIISKSQAYSAMQAVWGCISGLVDTEISAFVAEIANKVDSQSDHVERRWFVSASGKIIEIQHNYRRSAVEIKSGLLPDGSWQNVLPNTFDNEVNPGKAAQKFVVKFINTIITRHYKEIK